MPNGKIFLLCLGVAALSAVLCLASFIVGFGYAVTEFRIDPLSERVDKYVKLKDQVVVERNGSQILLPKGTVLYYEYRYKNTDSRASLKIIADFDEFDPARPALSG